MPVDEEKSAVSEKPAAPLNDTADPVADTSFAPKDGGRQAWLFLAGAAVIEIVAWGRFTFERGICLLVDHIQRVSILLRCLSCILLQP